MPKRSASLDSILEHHPSRRNTRGSLQTYDKGEFEALAGKYDALNWRIISKPGGATVKPDEYYAIYG